MADTRPDDKTHPMTPFLESETDRARIALLAKTALYEQQMERLQREAKLRERLMVELEGRLAEMRGSMSWRITAPMRVGRRVLDQVRRIARSLYLKARHAGLAANRRSYASEPADPHDYAEWVRRYDVVDDALRVAIHGRINDFAGRPVIAILMFVPAAEAHRCAESVRSVQNQLYTNWELRIVCEAAIWQQICAAPGDAAAKDERIIFTPDAGTESASARFHLALGAVTGEWVAIMEPGDVLPEHALFCVAEAINANPSVRLLYSDEDRIDESGRRYDPYFKCDWNLDLAYSQNFFRRLGVFHSPLLKAVRPVELETSESRDYDLILRCIEKVDANAIHHIPRVLYHQRAVGADNDAVEGGRTSSVLATERALNAHFLRLKLPCRVEWDGAGYRTRYALPVTKPLVSLIIPTRNGLEWLRKCVDSIVDKTTYENYEIIIIDNGSDDSDILAYFEKLKEGLGVRVLREDGPFNYSALNNFAVSQAHGEIVGLINNDIEVITPDWLSEMVSLALLPEVGAVGARLLYPDNSLQHGGVILGVYQIAGHANKYAPPPYFGHFGRSRLVGSYSALTAACLIVRKSTYLEIHGLNETDLRVAFNDIDFCIRLREAGYRNVWTPYAELYHHESATRGYEDNVEKQARFATEIDYMKRRWGSVLENDPAYNVNLTLNHQDFALAWPPRGKALVS